MPKRSIGFIAELVVECIQHGITDPEEIAKRLPGHYVVDESFTDKYRDILSATNAESD